MKEAIKNLCIKSKKDMPVSKKKLNYKNQVLTLFAFFLVSRSIMVLVGFRIHVDYAFMHFHNIELLQGSNFWETILYTHAFTPWINMIVGFVYLFPEPTHLLLYQSFFYLMSSAALFMFSGLLNQLKVNNWVILFTVCFFSITPAYIYFEHFLSYTFPSMVLILGVTYTFIFALKKETFKQWLTFFSLCVLLSFVRTTFHYIWLVAVFLGIFLVQKKASKKVVLGSILPIMLLFGWYMKNLILFGFLGASSWSGFNLAFTTINRLNHVEKTELINTKVVSPLAQIPIYSGIDEYHNFIDLDRKTGIAVLDEKKKGNNRWKNYNHIGFLRLSKLRMQDNLAYIKHFPFRYFKTVLLGLRQYFGPTTKWHPHDKLGSPHIPIRQKIERWENLYNKTLHTLPIKEMGLYVFVLLIVIAEMARYTKYLFVNKMFKTNDAVLAFSLMNIFYVTALSCLVTFGELARYRFMIEPFIWMIVISFLSNNSERITKFWVLSKLR